MAILAGAVPVMILDSPIPLLCILIIAKIVLDIRFHLKTHRTRRASRHRADNRQDVEANRNEGG